MSFMQAARLKYRYPSTKGELTTEQLFDLPLQSKSGCDLDNVAKEINRQLKAVTEESFVNTSTSPAKLDLEDKLAIVVEIIHIKQAENARVARESERRAERQKLTEILHLRSQEELMKLSPAEIQARLDALNA
jgi:hypothetical protein